MITTVLTILIYIWTVICMWKIFVKAGEKGWKSLIPIYNSAILFKITWKIKYFWIEAALIAVYLGISTYIAMQDIYTQNAYDNVMLAGAIILIAGLAAAVISIILYVKLSNAFGHKGGFSVGMVLLSPIFMGIIAFSGDKYCRGMAEETEEQAVEAEYALVDGEVQDEQPLSEDAPAEPEEPVEVIEEVKEELED